MVYYWNSPATAPHAEEVVGGEKVKEVAMGMGESSGVQQQQLQGKGKGPSTRRRG